MATTRQDEAITNLEQKETSPVITHEGIPMTSHFHYKDFDSHEAWYNVILNHVIVRKIRDLEI
jgi:hypothetical protein